jgi:hypothetical protein
MVPTIRVGSPRESSGPASGVDPRQAGIAAATASTAMQIGSSVGTAVLNTVALVAGAALVVAFLRPAAPAHHHNSGGSR